MRTTGQTTSK